MIARLAVARLSIGRAHPVPELRHLERGPPHLRQRRDQPGHYARLADVTAMPPYDQNCHCPLPALAFQALLRQPFRRRARSRRYSFKGRAGRPQNTCPGPCIFFPLNTPAPPPRITPAPTVACSPIPTCPPRIAPSCTTLDPDIPVCAAMM